MVKMIFGARPFFDEPPKLKNCVHGWMQNETIKQSASTTMEESDYRGNNGERAGSTVA